MYQISIELFIGKHVENSIDRLRSPFLQSQVRYVYQQIFKNSPCSLVFLDCNGILLRVKIPANQLQQTNPDIFIALLNF